MRDRLEGLWCDEDFADWYPRDRRPGLSPAQLATACVLQFLLGLSDRQCAEAARCRIDFKYALAAPASSYSPTSAASAYAKTTSTAPCVGVLANVALARIS
ncbi:transposase [Streptomyces sp. NPDC091416]|uniref:transposase n=1 Tax=Streptomyces sp. NPDC091416 TaxID=3366003 RepID=UPI00380CA965